MALNVLISQYGNGLAALVVGGQVHIFKDVIAHNPASLL